MVFELAFFSCVSNVIIGHTRFHKSTGFFLETELLPNVHLRMIVAPQRSFGADLKQLLLFRFATVSEWRDSCTVLW